MLYLNQIHWQAIMWIHRSFWHQKWRIVVNRHPVLTDACQEWRPACVLPEQSLCGFCQNMAEFAVCPVRVSMLISVHPRKNLHCDLQNWTTEQWDSWSEGSGLSYYRNKRWTHWRNEMVLCCGKSKTAHLKNLQAKNKFTFKIFRDNHDVMSSVWRLWLESLVFSRSRTSVRGLHTSASLNFTGKVVL